MNVQCYSVVFGYKPLGNVKFSISGFKVLCTIAGNETSLRIVLMFKSITMFGWLYIFGTHFLFQLV